MERLETQLLQAARDGDLGTVKAIVTQQGKDVLNICMNEYGQTPLHLASRYATFYHFAQLQLTSIPIVTPFLFSFSFFISTNIYFFFRHQHVEVVREMILSGANLNVSTK